LKEPQSTEGSFSFLKRGVILAYFPFKEGDLFYTDRALQGVENLYSTGLFQNIWLELDNPGNNRVILNIHFIPNPTRTIGIGANYFSDNGFSIFTQIVPFHFFGLGARFMPLARYGNVQKKAGLEISNSRFFSTALIFGGGGYYEKSSPYIYDSADDRQDQLNYESVIGQFSFGLQPFRKLIFSVGFRWERIWQQEGTVLNQSAVTHQNWSALGTLILDSRDNRYFPQKGIYLMMEGEALLNYRIRGPQYRKLETELNWTQSILKRNYLTPYARTGVSENGLPVYTKFRLGGPLYLPGYHRDQIWGNNFAVLGIEYRLQIYKEIYFQVNGSSGNIFNDYSDMKFSRYINGFSAGVAASTPVGPLQLLYGWNELEKKQFYFSLGYTF
jgi:outer membrane protein assembly factor BamA